MMGDRRLFVGNLPKDVSESTLENLFNKYQVSKIDIKRKKVLDDETVFAFVNISSNNVDKCLSELRNKKLDDCSLKIEPAKESFLDRLKKEHHDRYQTNQKSNGQVASNSFQLRHDSNGIKNKKIKFNENDFENPTLKVKNKRIKFNDSDEEIAPQTTNETTEENVPRKHNLPMFRGTASISVVDTKTEPVAIKPNPSREKVNVKNMTYDANTAMRKFEEFSDVWKDDFSGSNYEYRKISFKKEPKSTEEEETKNNPLSFKSPSNNKYVERQSAEEERKEKTWFNKKTLLEDFDRAWPNNRHADSNPTNEKQKQKTISWRTTNHPNEQSTENSHNDRKEVANWAPVTSEDDRFQMDENFFKNDDTTIPDEKGKRKKSASESFKNKIKNDDAARKVFEHRQLVRYDPTRPDHKILEKNVRKTEPSIADAKKKKTKKKEDKHQSEPDKKAELVKPEVSKEKHYSVADTLKDAFKKSENQAGFSLSSIFDEKIKEDPSSLPNRGIDFKKQVPVDNYHAETIPQQYSDDESEGDAEMETPIDIPSTCAASEKVLGKFGVWGETFFFKENDSRFKDAVEFFKPENESKVTDFDKQRTKLKSIVRKKLQNSKKDNKLFKQKLGGRLNKSKFKMRLKKARSY